MMHVSNAVEPAGTQGERKPVPLFPSGSLVPFFLVTALFFLWGVPNNLNDVLIRQFMKSFAISRFEAGLVQSAFYMGYFLLAMPAALLMRLAIPSSGGLPIFSAQRGEPQIVDHQRRQHRELILRLTRLAGPPIGDRQIAVHLLESPGQCLRMLEGVNRFSIIPSLEVMESDAEPVVGILLLPRLQNLLVLQRLRFATLGYQ